MPISALVKVATYDDPVLAHLARNKLEAAGIQAFLDGEHHVAMYWLISNAVGGIKLLVAEEDREAAIEILEATVKECLAVRPDGTHGEHCCPKCNSLDTYRERLHRKLIFLSILLCGIPLPFISRRTICSSCGNKWSRR